MVYKLPSNYFKRLIAGENVCRIALPLPGKMNIYLQIFGHHMYSMYTYYYVYVFGSPKLLSKSKYIQVQNVQHFYFP